MTIDTATIAALEGGTVTLGSNQLATLAGAMDGAPVLAAGDPGWDDAVLIWNGMVKSTPGLVLQPGSAAEVSAAVRFAADHGLLLTVKGGGHNIAGTSVAPGALTLEMSRMRRVEVDLDRRVVHVGAGCLLKHVDTVTQEHGLAAVLGFVSETGVAGLTLGGGIGYLTRRFGWTVDTLEEVEIVLADGQVVLANHDSYDDLFWALRGGGGNFGVATRFTFRLFEVGPMITGGLIAWPAEKLDEVVPVFRAVAEASPRELTMAMTIRMAPPAPFIPAERHGKPMVGLVICHTGADPAGDLAPILGIADPIASMVTEKPYVAQQSMLDATQPKGPHYYWKTEFIPGLSDGFLDAFAGNALQVTSPMSQSIIFQLAGALSERAADDGAMGNRDAAFVTGFASSWPPADERSADHVAWARESWQAIRPFSTGGNYVNFQVADDDAARTASAYGANLERLQQVKAAYDPHNLFRVNRNVSPAGG